jgi:hypothetical protein
MTTYPEMIQAVTGLKDPEQISEVEEIMRVETGGALGNLSLADFSDLARKANDARVVLEAEAE